MIARKQMYNKQCFMLEMRGAFSAEFGLKVSHLYDNSALGFLPSQAHELIDDFYALFDSVTGNFYVKHYHIKQNNQGQFYLSEKHPMPSVLELINYHKLNAGGKRIVVV